MRKRQFGIALLTLVNTTLLLGVVYYLLPGFPHVFTGGANMQPNAAFLCLLLFVLTFLTVAQLAPQTEEDREQGACWACGQLGTDLQWWTIDERHTGPRSNQRVSYLIHRQCAWLAERQAGL